MPVTPSLSEDKELIINYDKLSRGLDSRSTPTETTPDYLPPGLQNAMVSGGYYTTIPGSTLHIEGMVMPDDLPPKDFAYYVPSEGDPVYIAYAQNGTIYKWTDDGWVAIRSGLSSTEGVYATHTQIGDYLVMGNGVDPNLKYDGTTMLPLGGKFICGFEEGETWTGGAADTTNVREGVQGWAVTSTGTPAVIGYNPTIPLNLTSGLLLAKDYDTSDYINFSVYLPDGDGNIDGDNTYIWFGDVAGENYFYAPVNTWGTLAEGWNSVHIIKSAFTSAGSPDWNNIARVSFVLDTDGATVTATFDDVYMTYADDYVMPPVQFLSNWKNMVIGGKTPDSKSGVVFSPVSAPDEYDPNALLPVDENDGTNLTGLFPYFDLFLVFKDNSTHTLSVRLTGISYPEYVFGLKRVTNEHGCSSHRAIVEAGGKIYIPWRGNIYQFEGFGTVKISYRVDPTLTDFAPSYLHNMQGSPYRLKNIIYWFWTPEGETTNTTGIIYDYQEKAFLPYEGDVVSVSQTVFVEGTEYLLTANMEGEILRQHEGLTFNGEDIDTIIPLPWTSAGPPHGTVSWRELQLPYDTSTGSILVQYRVANHPREFSAATWTTAGTIDMGVVAEYGRVFIGERSRWVQFRVINVDGAFVTLYWPIAVRGRALGYLI